MSSGDSDAGDVHGACKKAANSSLVKFVKSASCNSASILCRLHSVKGALGGGGVQVDGIVPG